MPFYGSTISKIGAEPIENSECGTGELPLARQMEITIRSSWLYPRLPLDLTLAASSVWLAGPQLTILRFAGYVSLVGGGSGPPFTKEIS